MSITNFFLNYYLIRYFYVNFQIHDSLIVIGLWAKLSGSFRMRWIAFLNKSRTEIEKLDVPYTYCLPERVTKSITI